MNASAVSSDALSSEQLGGNSKTLRLLAAHLLVRCAHLQSAMTSSSAAPARLCGEDEFYDGVVGMCSECADVCTVANDFCAANCPGRHSNISQFLLHVVSFSSFQYSRSRVVQTEAFSHFSDWLAVELVIAICYFCDVLFTARCYASAVLAMGLCLSVSVCLSVRLCLSEVGVLLKRQNVGSHKQHHTIPQGL